MEINSTEQALGLKCSKCIDVHSVIKTLHWKLYVTVSLFIIPSAKCLFRVILIKTRNTVAAAGHTEPETVIKGVLLGFLSREKSKGRSQACTFMCWECGGKGTALAHKEQKHVNSDAQ